MVSENVKEIIDYLYHQHGNRCDSGEIVSQLKLSNEDFERIVYTPSIHKNLISWKSLADNGLLGFVRLTDVGIRYTENGYMFDHEKSKIDSEFTSSNNVIMNIKTLNQTGGFIAGINYGNISISDSNIDKIIEILHLAKVEDYNKIIGLLEDYKNSKDQGILQTISNLSGIGQLIIGMIQLGLCS